MSKQTRIIEVFRPGTFKPMVGEAITYTAEDLKAIAAAYDPAVSDAPAVIGHPKTDDPAYAWAERFFYDEKAERLKAEVGQIDPQFNEAVEQGRYRKVSLSFFRPDSPANPKPGVWYPRHIGFLGAAAPAVSGLKPVSFSGTDADVVEFGWADQQATASIMRRMREFFIEQFGLEKADQVIPDHEVRWLSDEIVRDEMREPRAPDFATPSNTQVEIPQMSNSKPVADPAADDRERALAERERILAERERSIVADNNASFADALISEGRFLPAHRERLINVLNAADHGEATVSFSDKAEPVGSELRSLLRELPAVVPLGQSQPGVTDEQGVSDFAVPPGVSVNSDGLELLNKAQSYQQKHKCSLNEALKAVSR